MAYLSRGILFSNKKKQRDAMNTVLRGEFVPVNPCTIKEERSQINDLTFYQKLEINTYRELPEIDIGMVTSTLGILVLKEKGFKKTNSIFQLISSILITVLFNFLLL